MCSLRRKRSADQSASMATNRTVSKPALRRTSQPVSRFTSLQIELVEYSGHDLTTSHGDQAGIGLDSRWLR
jgi:hypothetical protein